MHNNAFKCHDMCDMQHMQQFLPMQKMCMGKNHTHFWARTTLMPEEEGPLATEAGEHVEAGVEVAMEQMAR